MNIEESIEYLKLKIKNDNLTIQGMFGDIYEEIQKDNTAIETLLTAYENQQKEIQDLIINQCIYQDTSSCTRSISLKMYTDLNNYISKNKIKEILGIEENIDNDKLLSLLQTIVDENARLEDIEDKKVQIEYNNVFNKGVKSVEDKIKAKIEELKKGNKNTFIRGEKILVLQSILKRSNNV